MSDEVKVEEVVEATPIVAEEAVADEASKKKQGIGLKAGRRISNTIVYILLTVLTIIWLFPYVCIVLESLKVETKGQTNYVIPQDWGFDNYVLLFTKTDFMRWFLNTLIMGVVVALVQMVIILSVSYALSRMRFKGRKTIMNIMLVLGMFPGFLTMILLYKVLGDVGLIKSMAPVGLIIVYVASSGMGYYVSKGFFDTIPKSLDEAALVDGATRFQVFYKVILPLSKPIVIYTLLMGFMAPFGDFMLARYIASGTSDGMNVAVGMWNMLEKTSIGTKYTIFCAGGVVVSLPVTALFLCLQKYYVEGVTGGAVKG